MNVSGLKNEMAHKCLSEGKKEWEKGRDAIPKSKTDFTNGKTAPNKKGFR